MLGELQHQHDAAKATIAEVHQAYVALLEKKQEQALEELEALHSKQVLQPLMFNPSISFSESK